MEAKKHSLLPKKGFQYVEIITPHNGVTMSGAIDHDSMGKIVEIVMEATVDRDYVYENPNNIERVTKERDALLEALKDIKAEFERLYDVAETVRDKIYLDAVLAVISTRSETAIASVEGGAK